MQEEQPKMMILGKEFDVSIIPGEVMDSSKFTKTHVSGSASVSKYRVQTRIESSSETLINIWFQPENGGSEVELTMPDMSVRRGHRLSLISGEHKGKVELMAIYNHSTEKLVFQNNFEAFNKVSRFIFSIVESSFLMTVLMLACGVGTLLVTQNWWAALGGAIAGPFVISLPNIIKISKASEQYDKRFDEIISQVAN